MRLNIKASKLHNDETFLLAFGKSIKARRQRLTISQQGLANLSDLHRTYVCDIERGRRNLTLAVLQKLAPALNVSISKLFKDAEKILILADD